MINKENLLAVGKFQKTHALKGELNMISDVPADYFVEGNPLIVDLEGINVPYFVESIRTKGTLSYLVKLDGVDNEKQASEFVNKEVFILRKDADEWLDTEDMISEDYLSEFSVIDATTGNRVGKIVGVEDSTANILLIVENDEGEEIYLPGNEELIVEIDEKNKTLRLTIPDGLL